jgi:hypothetical protein
MQLAGVAMTNSLPPNPTAIHSNGFHFANQIKTLSFGDGFKQGRNEHEPATRSRGDQIKTWADEIKTHHQIHEFSAEKIIAPLRGRAKPDFRSE